jgi:hypothetical protein
MNCAYLAGGSVGVGAGGRWNVDPVAAKPAQAPAKSNATREVRSSDFIGEVLLSFSLVVVQLQVL